MLQSFETHANPSLAKSRVAHLRRLMASNKIDAYLVPHADEHQNEYLPACAERLKWLTGFSGSAGQAIICQKKAALFIDGRYTLQVKAECDPSLFEFCGPTDPKPTDWILSHLKKGATIGFDPWLHTIREITRLQSELQAKGLKLKPLPHNLIDKAWAKDRPPSPLKPVVVHPLEKAGRAAEKKIADIQAVLAKNGQDFVLPTLLDSIAWLFNLGGSDIAHTPVALAFALVPAKGKSELFIEEGKISKEEKKNSGDVVSVRPLKNLKVKISHLRKTGKCVRLDPDTAPYALQRGLSAHSLSLASDPCIPLKAIKNAVEITGTKTAHVRDGIAVVRFSPLARRKSQKKQLDEKTIIQELEKMRARDPLFKDLSFNTIAGSGPNGAIVHYRVTEQTNRLLENNDILLLDSGAQYEDGTTDITRTLALGTPTEEIKERATRVLKGHIAIATAKFPVGTRGCDLDSFARRDLWTMGLDYDHGTGHGVGSYLSVHERPQSISRSGLARLEPGMICSNEPGYYKKGAYGIRIENLVLVTEPVIPQGGDRPMLAFETLTLAPFDRKLISKELLSTAEINWIDNYHTHVRITLSPAFKQATRAWLQRATTPL